MKKLIESIFTYMIMAIVCLWIIVLFIRPSTNDLIIKKVPTLTDHEIRILELEKQVEELKKTWMTQATVTAYHPYSGGINAYDDPNVTATLSQPIPGRTCAISTSLFEKGYLNTWIYVDGYGMFFANDRMRTDLKGDRIDLCMGTYKQAMDIGVNKNVHISIAKYPYLKESYKLIYN
jgi:3D (Asp-Asp-Asp) domain-containing protein